MKRIGVIIMLSLVFSASCKKIVEDTKKNYALDIMTTGEWYIELYQGSGNDSTILFTGYSFDFEENGTLLAKGPQEQNGTWTGDIPTYSIVTTFPAAGEPLERLNGTWVLKDSAEEWVLAEMGMGAAKKVLKLRKKP